MLEKITELLGEELSKQVTEKLGDIELAIFNDGTVVPADKHEKLKADFKALEEKHQTDIGDFTSRLEQAMESTKDHDALKSELDKLKAENDAVIEKYKTETLSLKKASAVEMALMKANVDENYIEILKPQIKLDNLSFEDGTLIGLSDSIEGLKAKFPKMFGEVKRTGVEPKSEGFTPPVGKKQQLVEAYEKAEKARDAKKMMAIQSEIRNLKE